MDSLQNTEVIATVATGGTATVGFLVWSLRRMWRQYSAEIPETRKDQAEAALFENLRAEITRMGRDIAQIKADHKTEKAELENRIAELEAKVEKLTARLGTARRRALEAYALGLHCTCAERGELLAHLQDILEEE